MKKIQILNNMILNKIIRHKIIRVQNNMILNKIFKIIKV